jgi:sugar phosphate isomerase/epimerase
VLLTLAVSSLRSLVSGKKGGGVTLLDVPDLAIRDLSLRGLNIPSSMLAGWSLRDLDRLRDRADKAGCPCLVLVDDSPVCFEPAQRVASVDRIGRLGAAAGRLGCSAISIMIEAPNADDAFETCVSGVKQAMTLIERLELNLLLAPYQGLTQQAQRLTDLIKKVGGFRIGSLPSFAKAAECGDLDAALKRLAPYAGALHASVKSFDKSGKHQGWDLTQCVDAIQSVGYVNTLAIEYTGNGDPLGPIEQARNVLSQAIEAVAES